MKNILISLPNDSRMGGSDEILYQIALHYAKQRDSVYIVFITRMRFGDWHLLYDYPNVHFIDTKNRRERTGVIPYITHLINLRKTSFDLAFCSNPHTIGIVGFLKRIGFLKIESFVGREMCSCFLRYKGAELSMFILHQRLGYPALKLLICQTELMRNQFIQGAKKLSKKIKIEVIPNPINIEAIKSGLTEKVDLSNEYKYIVAAGRLVVEKGFDLLISAFKQLYVEDRNLRLVILGEGALRQELECQISDLQLNEAVILKGMVKNVYPYFQKATMCVVSSRIEGFPNVLLQMISQCNRVVSTLCAGGIEEIQGLKTCEPENIVSLYKAMRESLQQTNDKEIRSLFDKELLNRSVESFINKIEKAVN